ncbi:hypothetical protein CEP88_09445 [Roseobacter denitrificans]|uniref:hypothetical protein n=1 Tax=Roseobacter denitrificans TaxID=2434 RepID=UPI000681BBF2|nr:hypothetical protein [Roseobacter denitrificans]AVL52803.1 hypothetical protein CEP88_09445 [Roseobacter denitrificans]SFG05287.1 hypothetical protein SAMN05443635_106185 [Roseobacter denitrificans OCh 114]
MLHISPSDFVQRFALQPNDTLTIEGFDWTVLEGRGDRVVVLPKDRRGMAQEFSDTQLAHFERQNLLTHQPAASPQPHVPVTGEAAVEFLASLPPKKRKRVEECRAVVLAFNAAFEAKQVKKTHPSIDENKEKFKWRRVRFYKSKEIRRSFVPSSVQSLFFAGKKPMIGLAFPAFAAHLTAGAILDAALQQRSWPP